MKIIKISCYIAATAFISQCGFMQAVTLEEAIISAYNNNKDWQAKKTDKKVADEQFLQSKIMFLPSINGTISHREIKDDVKSVRTDHTRAKKIGIAISQNIFSGFSDINRKEAYDSAAKAAYYKLRCEEQKLIINVFNAYLSIWASRHKLDASRKKEANLFKILESQKISLEAGVITLSDVEQANANYQKAIYDRINAETELFSAESEFEKITMIKADNKIDLPNINLKIPKNLEILNNKALRYNCAIAYAKMKEQAAAYELKMTKGKLAPSFDAALETGRYLEKYGEKRTRNNFEAKLEVTVPIFSNSREHGNTYSAINIANQNALKAKFEEEDTVLDVKKECVINWNTYISASALIQSSQSAVKSAEVASRSNLEETSHGLKSNTEVWLKENQLLESKVDLTNAQKQKMLTAIKLLELTGELSLDSILKKDKNLNAIGPMHMDKKIKKRKA